MVLWWFLLATIFTFSPVVFPLTRFLFNVQCTICQKGSAVQCLRLHYTAGIYDVMWKWFNTSRDLMIGSISDWPQNHFRVKPRPLQHCRHTASPNTGHVMRSDSVKCDAAMHPSHIGGPRVGSRRGAAMSARQLGKEQLWRAAEERRLLPDRERLVIFHLQKRWCFIPVLVTRHFVWEEKGYVGHLLTMQKAHSRECVLGGIQYHHWHNSTLYRIGELTFFLNIQLRNLSFPMKAASSTRSKSRSIYRQWRAMPPSEATPPKWSPWQWAWLLLGCTAVKRAAGGRLWLCRRETSADGQSDHFIGPPRIAILKKNFFILRAFDWLIVQRESQQI